MFPVHSLFQCMSWEDQMKLAGTRFKTQKPLNLHTTHSVKLWNSLLWSTVNAKSLHSFKKRPKSQKKNPARAFKCQDPPEEVPEYKCWRTENTKGKMMLWCFCGPMLQTTIKDHWTVVCQSFYVLFNGPLTVAMGSGIFWKTYMLASSYLSTGHFYAFLLLSLFFSFL